jgi:nucleotide-binding universal stress UspA family protein
MKLHPSVLCPVDFSDAGRGALRYARAIAEHIRGRLVLLAVEDPLLTEAVDLGTGVVWRPDETRHALARFAARTLAAKPLEGADVSFEVAVGRPADEILRVAREEDCDLIVMSTHGVTGARKLFFGSTTERVLRETTIPVLVTPPAAEGPLRMEDARRAVGRILVPVDLTKASLYHVQVARGLSEVLRVPLVVTYVVEPVRSPLATQLHLPSIDLERRTRAEDALGGIVATVPRQLRPEMLVAYGDPAEEIAKIARDRRAGLVVIGLHGSHALGPRMGSVTFRVLCLTPALVLALPDAMMRGRQDVISGGLSRLLSAREPVAPV